MWLPERDKLAHTYNELNAQLASLFGGRIAEELYMVKIILLLVQEMIFNKLQT